MSVDQGTRFGTWEDNTSRFMYHESLIEILDLTRRLDGLKIGDFGGANGILKFYVPDSTKVTTVDTDAAKEPDIVDDVLTHDGHYDIIWCRYLLHYLSDSEVIQLTSKFNADRMIVVQFVNDDLVAKYSNSADGGVKYFRTREQLQALLPKHRARLFYSADYVVPPEFYAQRLGVRGHGPHEETIVAYAIGG